MALALDLANLICTVTQTDMNDVTAGQPTEVRELNANAFRKEWGALMDNEPNVSYPWPFEWTQPKTLGGITYAGLLEIINGWTMQFTVGAYGVNIVGATTNLADVVVPAAGVGVNTQNSAGQIETAVSGLTPTESASLTLMEQITRNTRLQDAAHSDGPSWVVLTDDNTGELVKGLAWNDVDGTVPWDGTSPVLRVDRME